MNLDQFNNNYNENASALYNFALKLTSNTTDAEDLVQETAFKAFRAMHTFKENSNFKSWAFTILKNTFITQYRKKRKKSIINAPIEDLDFLITNSYAVKNDAYAQMRTKEINKHIQKLSSKCEEPFSLYLEGYQYDEIAEQLNIPIGTVKSRLNYARNKLKTSLTSQEIMA